MHARWLFLAAAIGIPALCPDARAAAADSSFILPFRSASSGEVFNTYGTSVAVDAGGGVHVAYAQLGGAPRPAFYAYCAAQCGSVSSWRYTQVGDQVSWVNLALDPQGHPRLLLVVTPRVGDTPYGDGYAYAFCDGACTEAANWKSLLLLRTSGTVADSSRSFALDRQGRPRFVYQESIVDNSRHYGAFLVYCDHDCTSGENWSEVQLFDQTVRSPALALTAAGEPRLLFSAMDFSGSGAPTSFVVYVECDLHCQSGSVLALSQEYRASTFGLRLDSGDHPRVAIYTDQGDDQAPMHLYYLWCGRLCADPDRNEWQAASVPLPDTHGEFPDLTLDRQDRPHISYATYGSGGYSRCTANCESDQGAWEHRRFEIAGALDQSWYLPGVRRCSVSAWLTGDHSSLALDPAGNPRIGMDAKHTESGVDDKQRSCSVSVETRLAVFTVFDP